MLPHCFGSAFVHRTSQEVKKWRGVQDDLRCSRTHSNRLTLVEKRVG